MRVTEQDVFTYAVNHVDVLAGAQYHTAAKNSRRWVWEKSIPAMLRAFSPGDLADELGKCFKGEVELDEKVEGGGRWYVRRLFHFATGAKVPSSVQFQAVRAIRELQLGVLVALHPPLTDADEEEEAERPLTPAQEYERERFGNQQQPPWAQDQSTPAAGEFDREKFTTDPGFRKTAIA
jgi:hypothetical protein